MCKAIVINKLNNHDVMRTSHDYGLFMKELIATHTKLCFQFKIDLHSSIITSNAVIFFFLYRGIAKGGPGQRARPTVVNIIL